MAEQNETIMSKLDDIIEKLDAMSGGMSNEFVVRLIPLEADFSVYILDHSLPEIDEALNEHKRIILTGTFGLSNLVVEPNCYIYNDGTLTNITLTVVACDGEGVPTGVYLMTVYMDASSTMAKVTPITM